MELISNWDIKKYHNINSTQDIAFELIRNHDNRIKHGTVISANGQFNGVGRNNKKWYAEDGDIAITIILKYDSLFKINAEYFSQIPYVIAVALIKTVLKLFTSFNITNNSKIECKWPNDILINGKKLSGIIMKNIHTISNSKLNCVINKEQNILFEEQQDKKDTNTELDINFNNKNGSLLIGIGINLVFKEILNEINGISLTQIGITIEKDVILSILLENIKEQCNNWLTNGFDAARILWLKYAYKINEIIKLPVGENNLEGKFIDIADDGALIIISKIDNKEHKIYVSDIWN